MTEHNGFTGRVWEATPADKLVHDLVTGPGAMPMANAGVAFGQLSAVLAEAAVEYQAILGDIGEAWRSTDSEVGVQRLTALRNWLAEAAESAAANAARADAQAVAYTAATAAMPTASEQAAWQALKDMAAAGIPLSGPLSAMAATVEDQAHAAKSRAAQVMRDYETATTPIAQPWTPPPAPVLTSPAALMAERQQATPQSVPPSVGVPPPMSIVPGYPSPPILPTPVAAVSETVSVNESATTEVRTVATATPTTQVAQTPMAPMTAAAAGGSDEYVTARPAAGPTDEGVLDGLGPDAGWSTAPPVLGGTAVPMVRAMDTGQERT